MYARILVATDCLSEGINLQQLFDTVVHYDLSWNPTRHQQREGRVDRFGQPAELVRSMMMFSPDSAIDGAVLLAWTSLDAALDPEVRADLQRRRAERPARGGQRAWTNRAEDHRGRGSSRRAHREERLLRDPESE